MAVTALLCFAMAAGSFYCTTIDGEKCQKLQEYLTVFLSSAGSGMNKSAVFQKSALEYGAVFLLIFLGGFFRPGILLSLGCLLQRGFSAGFTGASFLRIYGWKGLLGLVTCAGNILLLLPAVCIFCAVSMKMSLLPHDQKKNFYWFYIFFGILILTIFCGCALFDSNITTIFMKHLSGKIM